MSSSNDIRQRPEFQQNFQLARSFYNADRHLDTTDRRNLVSAFRAPVASAPLCSLPGLILGIQLPTVLQKYGYFPAGKNTRIWQVFAGFAGLIIGSNVGASAGYWYAERSLSYNESARTVYRILRRYPPAIGQTYYSATLDDRSKCMPDPDTINWKKEIIFPYNLAIHIREIPEGTVREALPGPTPHPGSTRSTTDDNFYKDEGPESEDNDPFEQGQARPPAQSHDSGSSWDRIRAQNRAPVALKRDRPSSTSSPTNLGKNIGTSSLDERAHDYQETQQQFDRELEQERLGHGTGDDFSESEKRWS